LPPNATRQRAGRRAGGTAGRPAGPAGAPTPRAGGQGGTSTNLHTYPPGSSGYTGYAICN